MERFLIKRILMTLPVLLGVATIAFFLLHLVPGDPAAMLLGETAEEADRVALRAALGLDLPLMHQYARFLGGLARGEWGESISHRMPVFDLILERFPSTLILASVALAFATFVSVPMGLFAAARRGRAADQLAMAAALFGHSLPLFVLAPLAMLAVSINARLLPVSGSGTWRHLILPTLCLGVGLCGLMSRMLRSSAVETLRSDFIRTARAKGLGPWRLHFVHALKPSMLPLLSVWGSLFGGLLGGAVVTETLFDWPGLGRLFYTAFQARDYPLVQGIVVWIAFFYIGVQILVDILYALADPRIRYESEPSA